MKNHNPDTQTKTAISRYQILAEMKKLHFTPDVEGNEIVVFRRTKFPFERLSFPNDAYISLEYIKLLANDLGVSPGLFLPEENHGTRQ